MPDIPYGYCHCGCGTKTDIANVSNRSKGWIRGEPKKFIQYHHNKLQSLHPQQYEVDNNGCWVWKRSLTTSGYGGMTVNGKWYQAHKYFYEQAKGKIPKGKELDHTCRNRACVNPEHLEPVTHKENVRRGKAFKLTDAQVEAIRELKGIKTYAVIANEYQVSLSLIDKVMRGEVR